MNPDSTNIVIDSGIPILNNLLPQIGMLFVIPLLQLIKKTALASWFRPVVWAGWLSLLATWVASAIWAPDAGVETIFKTAAEMTGSSAFAYALVTSGGDAVKKIAGTLMSMFR